MLRIFVSFNYFYFFIPKLSMSCYAVLAIQTIIFLRNKKWLRGKRGTTKFAKEAFNMKLLIISINITSR